MTRPSIKDMHRLDELCDGDHELDAKAFKTAAMKAGLMGRNGASVVKIAEATGVDRATIYRHLRGTSPTVETLCMYADGLKVSAIDLVRPSRVKRELAKAKAQLRELGAGQ